VISAAVVVAAHAVLLLLLALGIHAARSPNEAPPLEVTLTRLFTPHPKPTPRPAPLVAHRANPPPSPRQAAPSPPLQPPVALPENGPVDPRIAAAEAMRGALQAMVRCAHPDAFNMDPAERAACARLSRQLAAGAPTFVVDPADHARHDPPVASHGMAAHIGPLSPRPGYDLGKLY